MNRTSLILALATIASCGGPSLTRIEDTLRGEEVRTLVLEEGFSFYSPYDARRTAQLARMIAANQRAVGRHFEVGFDRPLRVVAKPLEMEGVEIEALGGLIRVSGSPTPPTLHDIGGYATRSGGTPTVVFFVAKDTRTPREGAVELTTAFLFDYSGTVRHELAHLHAARAGLEGPDWFDEAIALEVELSDLTAGELVSPATPATLPVAAEACRRFGLADLLDWKEDGDAIARGEQEPFVEGRPLAHSYLRFLLRHLDAAPGVTAYRRIREMDRGEHLALEESWRRWLADPDR